MKLLTTRTSAEVCDELENMVAFFEALQTEGLLIGETCRIKRLHSDKAGELTAPFFAKFLSNHKTIDHTFTSGYDPQANRTAERSVGLLKALAARSLASAGLGSCVLVLCCKVCISVFTLPCPAENSEIFTFWCNSGCSSTWPQRHQSSQKRDP